MAETFTLEPTACHLWTNPEAIRDRPVHELFTLETTYFDHSHDWRYLLRCRQCGQHYLLDAHEEVDWEEGMDGLYVTYLPVRDAAQGDRLARLDHMALGRWSPCLRKDTRIGQNETTIAWSPRRGASD